MIADRATARELLTRKLAKIDRGIKSAARRHDDATAERLSDLYLFVHAERVALDWAQRRARG